ncbi:MAG: T9SS type A sorting domain-containing protein [Dysgonamonadaceae bacterium]|jgi:hypothetical protein|nr:T9SS type A sorting domain-containing protein [Dysgonamonadaceae bacterium]
MKRFIFIIVALALLSMPAFSQQTTQGTDFYISYADISTGSPFSQIKIVTSKPTNARFVFSGNPGLNFTEYIPAGTVLTHQFTPTERTAILATTTVGNRSVEVHADNPVSIYVINATSNNGDATLILPTNAWGTEYYHIARNPSASNRPDKYVVVAAENGTVVYRNGGSPVTLNAGQSVVYTFSGTTDNTGVRITSNNPIAYFISTEQVQGTSGTGMLYEQLPPVNLWGRNFMVPVAQTSENVRVLASQDETTVTYWYGTTAQTFTLNAGQYRDLVSSTANRGCYIESDRPVAVASYLAPYPSLAWIAPIQQTIQSILVAPFSGLTNLPNHYGMLVTSTQHRDLTRMTIGSGASAPLSGGTWVTGAGNGNYSYYIVPLTNATSSYTFTNPYGLLAWVYGIGSNSSYFYLGGSGTRSLDIAFYANNIHNQDMHFEVFDSTNDIDFKAAIEGILSGNEGNIKWFINDVEEVAARDLMNWSKHMPNGVYYVRMEVELLSSDGGTTVRMAEGSFIIGFFPEVPVVHVRTWTGNIDQDWNNPGNWKDEEGNTSTIMPDIYSKVYIPGGTVRYPSLEEGSTTRTPYANGRPDGEPTCDEAYLHFGSEIAQQHYLEYNKAHIELTLNGNRWYMLSAPLYSMFPGDFYKTNPNPIEDGLIVYTRLFARDNPQTGQSDTEPTGGWTGVFNTPDVAMPAGFGFSVWLDDGTDIGVHEPTSIWLPKHDDRYYMYTYAGVPYDVVYLDRNNEHRFVYETSDWDKNTGIVSLEVKASGEGMSAIVGNPFMAHWNFDEFYAENSDKIVQEYKLLLPGDGAFTTYTPDVHNGLTNLISPMQSILVTSITSFFGLTTNAASTETKPGVTLRSNNNDPNPSVLTIVATKGERQNRTSIVFDESASNDYVLGEDSYKLFERNTREPIVVYTRSSDGIALDINLFGDTKQMIPVGIRTSQTGNISLQFEGLENFMSEYDLSLIDAKEGMEINLKEVSTYNFEKTTSDLFLDGRFYLSFKKTSTGILTPEPDVISIFTAGNQLQVISGNTDIKEVQVIDMQGRMVYKVSNIGSSAYTQTLESGQMYIIRVSTGQGMIAKKVITNQ